VNVSVNRPASLTPMPAGGNSRGDQGGLVVVFLVLLFATFLFSANSSSGQRSAIAGVVTLLIFPIVWFAPRAGLPAIVIYLMTMGGFRRFLIPLLGYTELDPLLLVSPFVATICFINFIVNRQIKPTTQLSKWALALMAFMGVAVFNPLQGSPLIGLTGAAFYLVPLMWYCIGRNFGSAQVIKSVSYLVLFTSTVGAFYGLKQHFFGFSDAELQWFALSTFTNQVGGTQRAMSFYTSPAEYANFLSIGIVVCVSLFLKGQRAFIPVALFLAYAMLLTGIRGIVFCCAGACMVMWAVQGNKIRAWIPRLVVACLVVGVGGLFGLQQIGAASESVGGGASGAEMVNHQIEGLTDPFGKKSTAQGHIGLITTGILSGIKMPIGYGLGSSTMGVGRFGGSTFFNAENDLGSIFYSLGVFGGIAFVGSIVVAFRAAGLYWHHTRSYAPLVLLGIFVSSNGNWLTAGNYAQSVLVWLLVGCLDRAWRDGKTVPGYVQKSKQNKSSIAIWKRSMARRLSGVSPSWEASYRRANSGTALRTVVAPSDSSDLSETQEEHGEIKGKRLTPSAQRALERATREMDTSRESGLQGQETV
jgi:hypothetical protein